MIEVIYGMEGYEVKLLQYALARSDKDPGNLDGIFGRRTAKALLQFQREHGLAVDGIAGKLTWAALYPYIAGYTLHKDGREVMTELLDLPVITDLIPCSYLLTGLMLRGLCMRYPFLRVCEIGRSVMGRPLNAISMGKGSMQVGIVGPHHADRWANVPGMLRFIEEFAAAYVTGDAWAQDLYETAAFHLLPLVNPDGVDLVTGALFPGDSYYEQARALASHYPDIPFPEGWIANITGVDLSLQYPTGWDKSRNIRFRQGFTRPGPRDYVGSEPMITPETRTIAKWTRDRDFSLVLSYDRSYADWFTDTWGRPGYALSGEAGEELSVLVERIVLSP